MVAWARVKRITFQCMPWTRATLFLLAGANVKALTVRLGNTSIQITLDNYMHLLRSLLSVRTPVGKSYRLTSQLSR